jgi:hypothetical protein
MTQQYDPSEHIPPHLEGITQDDIDRFSEIGLITVDEAAQKSTAR